ncbi:MAG TPA: class I SAM-dependent methyltransferase [Acidimicrobiia bacterium]|nr:class I SAM-dependent methyltransferase [Acidimicrobiia bacterium]
MTLDPREPGYKGFKDYTPRFLKRYDQVVGFIAPRVWKTGMEPALNLYRKHMRRRHLDVGPGTGFLIVGSDPPINTHMTLVDPNPGVLQHCAQTLAAWAPTMVRANVLEPLPLEGPFDSAALAHVIHCLPGPMPAKARAIEHIAAVLTRDGVLFGGTVLGFSANHSWPARMFLHLANFQGAFDNRGDDVEGLRAMLEDSFEEVEIHIPTGSLAYFVASRPRRLQLDTIAP